MLNFFWPLFWRGGWQLLKRRLYTFLLSSGVPLTQVTDVRTDWWTHFGHWGMIEICKLASMKLGVRITMFVW